jgi:acetolactate decarboxylase
MKQSINACSCETSSDRSSAVYLSTPINALVEGIFEENVSFSEIKTHGDFGLGTLNDLDGEMMMLDGMVYQIDSEGRVNVIGDEALTPFACVTFYRSVCHDYIEHEMDYNSFIDMLKSLIPSTNLFYAIRVEGIFSHIRTRSVMRQESYRPIVEATRNQRTFDFQDIKGTIAGFFTPSFMASLNVPGYHLHFLSQDLKHGGHLLECTPAKAEIGIQFIDRLELSLPMTLDYLTQDFNIDVEKDLEKVEK